MSRREKKSSYDSIFDINKYTIAMEKSFNNILKYFNGDTLAANVFRDKYESHNRKMDPKSSPDIMHRKIAMSLAALENKYINPIPEEEIYELLKDFKYIIPGGSIMYGINNGGLVSLGNCFVIGNENEKDSYGTIMRRDEEQIQLMKRRGGVGQDLSFIRGRGSRVNNSALTSTGVVPFMKRYSNSTREVAQEGRRGASMQTISVSHPDILEVINAKANTTDITGSNISIKIKNNFMNRIIKKDNKPNSLSIAEQLDNVRNGNFFRPTDKVIFKEIIKNARNFSEPGILFWDRIMNQIDSTIYNDFRPISTNPCGELPLSGYESCRLMSMNLYSYVNDPFTGSAEFDFSLFEKHVIIAQRLMDDIVDIEIIYINNIISQLEAELKNDTINYEYADSSVTTELNLWKKVLDKTIRGRRTGLGHTAAGDMFAALGMQYGSSESIFIYEEISKTFAYASYKSSIIMAKERGRFPECKTNEQTIHKSVNFIETITELFYDEPELIKMWNLTGRRNIQNLAIAPTGTISIMTQTSSGIEPVFNLRYTRRRRPSNDTSIFIVDDNGDKWEEFNVVHNKFKVWYEITHPEKDSGLLELMSDKDFNEIVKKSPYYKATSHEVDPFDKITLQGTAQKYIDSSISITHNLPEDITEEEVYKMALYAYEIGCKGFTVYREGSRSGILINNKKRKDKLSLHNATKRPKAVSCNVNSTMVNGEKWIVIIGTMEGEPYELFAFKDRDNIFDSKIMNLDGLNLNKIKKGHYQLRNDNNIIIDNIISYFETPEEEVITRLLSWGLRHGGGVNFAYEQLLKSRGNITDFSKAIARVLKKYIQQDKTTLLAEKCPVCGNTVKFEGGCVSCTCGWSKCD